MREQPLAEWHYIGNYGQLGPLKEDQMQELIEVGVIESKTYVWRDGLPDWMFAKDVQELVVYFDAAPSGSATPPPPPPGRFDVAGPGPFDGPKPDPIAVRPVHGGLIPPRLPAAYHPNVPAEAYVITSDKSRTVAGILNFLPGFGRFYLGYSAIGLLQLMLSPCGIGWVWSIIDGVGILAGACPEDGYGRQLIR
ncbi:MAG: GYF domain-containing protein [Fimbriimonadaceae bacterium]